jgi:hypothetical protein
VKTSCVLFSISSGEVNCFFLFRPAQNGVGFQQDDGREHEAESGLYDGDATSASKFQFHFSIVAYLQLKRYREITSGTLVYNRKV